MVRWQWYKRTPLTVIKKMSCNSKANPLARCVSGGEWRRRLVQTEWCWKTALMDVLWSIDIRQTALQWSVTVLFQLMWLSISVFSQLFNYFLPDDQRRRLAQWYMIEIRTLVCSPTKRFAFLPPSGSIASTELRTFWLPRYWMSCHPSWYFSLERRILLNLEFIADIRNQRCSASWKL